ncbi:MAG: hypothetical protein R3F11_16225 [Verrucomicrobiales bacterium]
MPEEENAFELLEAAAGLGHMSEEDNPEVREHYTRIFESKDYGSEDTANSSNLGARPLPRSTGPWSDRAFASGGSRT